MNDITHSEFSLINGEERAVVSVNDRGLNFGDGLFETMLSHRGRITLLDYHLKRLQHGCVNLMIPLELDKIASYLDRAHQWAEQNRIRTFRLKVLVTRGAGSRASYPADGVASTVVLIAKKITDGITLKNDPVELLLSPVQLPNTQELAGIKHTNRLMYTLGASKVSPRQNHEVLFTDVDKCVVETMQHNIFFCRGGVLETPSLELAGVAGVMRRYLIDILAPAVGLNVKIKNTLLDDLSDVDEIFITNAVTGMTPVKKLADRDFNQFSICNQLQALWCRVVQDNKNSSESDIYGY